MGIAKELLGLVEFLKKVPGVGGEDGIGIGSGMLEDGNWWVKFPLDIDHPLAWNVVQEMGHILNYLSLEERLPVTFMPVSPPPYMNGGPRDFLSWVIESQAAEFTPDTCMKWLEGRMPDPVDDVSQWGADE